MLPPARLPSEAMRDLEGVTLPLLPGWGGDAFVAALRHYVAENEVLRRERRRLSMSHDSERAARVVLVSGPSGAGRSSAINVLEDLGFEAIDNLPLSLIPRLLDGPPLPRPLALGVDVRNRDFSTEAMIELVDEVHRTAEIQCELLYLDCDTDTLLRRFSETRRRHPLSPEDPPLIGLQRELELLAPVRDRADVLIDTTALTPHQLRTEIARWFAPPSGQDGAVDPVLFLQARPAARGGHGLRLPVPGQPALAARTARARRSRRRRRRPCRGRSPLRALLRRAYTICWHLCSKLSWTRASRA
jgi:hypothetical protein